jgi:hypothetical protein
MGRDKNSLQTLPFCFVFRSGFSFEIENDFSGDPGCNATNLRASLSAMASHVVKGLALLRDIEPIGPTITDFVNLRAKGVTHLLSEKNIYLIGYLHRNLELFFIFQPLPADQRTDGHDRTGQGTTGLSPFGDPCGKSTSRFKDFFASYVQFFLQSCKNGLRSPKVIHIVLKRQFKDFVKQFFLTHPMSSSLDFVFPRTFWQKAPSKIDSSKIA